MAGRNKNKAEALSPDEIAEAFIKPMSKGPSTKQKRETLTAILPSIKNKAKAEIAVRDPRGRKSTYTRERFTAVCDLMASGRPCHEALTELGIPSSTFTGWLNQEGPEGLYCRDVYARARQALADWAFSEALAVPQRLLAMAVQGAEQAALAADDTGKGKAPKPLVDSAMVGAARLVTDSLKWYAERLSPASYAEQKAPPPSVTVNNNSLTISGRDLAPDQREQLRALLTAAKAGPALPDDSGIIEG